jgi:hypothetical protein
MAQSNDCRHLLSTAVSSDHPVWPRLFGVPACNAHFEALSPRFFDRISRPSENPPPAPARRSSNIRLTNQP